MEIKGPNRSGTGDDARRPDDAPVRRRLERDASPREVDDVLVLADEADVVDSGLYSDASVHGLGADLDSMPGDETPISRP